MIQRPALAALLASSLFAGLVPLAAAQDNVGPTYPIAEPDMLQDIERHLKEKERSGELARLQKEAIERSTNSAKIPKPVPGLTRTAQPRTFYFDPTVVANEDILGPDGVMIVKKGTRLNPLDTAVFRQWFVFIDARDAQQVRKAEDLLRQANGNAKIILTGGSFIDLQKRLQMPVYFDQLGTLVKRFGIQQVPAVVYQEGKRLRIDELKL